MICPFEVDIILNRFQKNGLKLKYEFTRKI